MTKEELKTATTEKLISALEYCGRDNYYATYYGEVVDEITKRLKQREELEKQIEKMKHYLNEFMRISVASVEEFEPEFSELVGEVETFLGK